MSAHQDGIELLRDAVYVSNGGQFLNVLNGLQPVVGKLRDTPCLLQLAIQYGLHSDIRAHIVQITIIHRQVAKD